MTIGAELIRLAGTVSLEGIRGYLSARDWTITAVEHGKLLRIEGPPAVEGGRVFAAVPVSRDSADFPVRVSELAQLVGAIENRPGEEVLRDMAATATSEAKPLAQDSPFHLRGYIGPQHAAAWAAMKWHNEIIESVIRDLDHSPPEYVLVRAPALSGKTTFAMQFMHRLAEVRPDTLTVYLPLGGANASHAKFLDAVRDGLASRVRAWLDASEVPHDEHHEMRKVVDSWAGLRADNLAELLRAMLWHVPEVFRGVVFVMDDCEWLPRGQRELVAEELRSIHAARRFGPLSRFSVVVLARSLLRYPIVVSPLANVVVEYRLNDFTLEETQQFLDGCGGILSGLRFDPGAVQYLHRKTGGQAIAIQRICATATRKKTGSAIVDTSDILDGICECFEAGGGFVDRVLDLDPLMPESRATLDRMLRENHVLPFDFDPAVGQLMDLGLAKIGDQKRCVCRSPLIRELLEFRYLTAPEHPGLTTSELRLLDLPQVLPLLCNDPLFDEICAAHPGNHVGFTSGEAEGGAKALIERRCPDIDMAGIEYCVRRYFGDLEPPPNREDVLRVIAKVYLHWCKQES